MIRLTAAFPLAVALLSSCASAPPSDSEPIPRQRTVRVPPKVTPTPAPEVAENKGPIVVQETRKKLAPNTCNDCFDCVDTVGFAPDGYRWSCVSGSCVRAKLDGPPPTAPVALASKPSKAADSKPSSLSRAKSACKGEVGRQGEGGVQETRDRQEGEEERPPALGAMPFTSGPFRPVACVYRCSS
jgi:hypothetical protein